MATIEWKTLNGRSVGQHCIDEIERCQARVGSMSSIRVSQL